MKGSKYWREFMVSIEESHLRIDPMAPCIQELIAELEELEKLVPSTREIKR